EKWGETVTAWAVLKPHTSNIQIEDLRKHVRLTLPDYCAPKKLFVVDQIPRSSLGKVLMSDLSKLSNKLNAKHE
ncbi:MAG: hypothetical protein NWP41_03465, partial [Ilumatobacteraceae bacterium]|nr:hypothetical protein [Ilumatobacteraceae bacterium]